MHKLFSFLLHFWFTPALGMFFAEGASALATAGEGGGDGGGGDSSGDAGAAAGDGSSSADNGGDSGDGSGEGISDSLSTDGEGANDPNALVDSGDGRKIPAKYKELFDKDKDLRNTYFNQQALKKAFPGGVKDAVQLARDVEEMGGIEGMERLQSQLQSHDADAKMFEAGDPKWIESSFAENPDVSLKHFMHALDYVAENHSGHYDHLMAKVIVNDLNTASPIGAIYQALLAQKDNPESQKLAKQLADYYSSRAGMSKKVPEKQIDPQQKKIDEKNQELTKREQEIRNKAINTESGPYMTRSIEGALGAAAKSSGFDLAKLQKEQPNRYGRFLKDVRSAVHADVLGDSKWLDRYTRALAENDSAKCVRLLNARHDQAIKGSTEKPGVVAAIFHEWFGPPKANARAAAARSAASGSGSGSSGSGSGRSAGAGKETPALVNALPAAKDINYSDPATDKWNGIYRLKTGKLIQVKRP